MSSCTSVKLAVGFMCVFVVYFVDGRPPGRLRTRLMRLEYQIAHLAGQLHDIKYSHVKLGQGNVYANEEIGFYATLSTNQHVETDDRVTFDQVITNLGNAYDSKTGNFLCPQAGTYLFNLNILSTDNDYVEADIMINNESKMRTISYNKGSDSYSQGSGSAILRLSKGDVTSVKITYTHGSATLLNKYSFFSGYLLKSH